MTRLRQIVLCAVAILLAFLVLAVPRLGATLYHDPPWRVTEDADGDASAPQLVVTSVPAPRRPSVSPPAATPSAATAATVAPRFVGDFPAAPGSSGVTKFGLVGAGSQIHGRTDLGCGWGAASAFGDLRFDVQTAYSTDSHVFTVYVRLARGNTTALSFSARAVGGGWMSAARERALDATASAGPGWAFDFGPFSSAHPSAVIELEVDVHLTWVDSLYVGQKWSLPDRNDNPNFAEKKRKCLALTLTGRCPRWGALVFQGVAALRTHSTASQVCSSREDATGSGAWRATDPSAAPDDTATTALPLTLPLDLLDDAVGLNRLNGSVWSWAPHRCRPAWYDGAGALAALHASGVRRLALFGDSMLVEMFHQAHALLAPTAPIRQRKEKRARVMEFTVPAADGGREPALTVVFLRSYTTSEGRSVLAAPHVVAQQLQRYRPQLVLGNLAVLHWQQNMRSAADWRGNVATFAAAMCKAYGPPPASRNGTYDAANPGLFYWGDGTIQMGRTQGLQPLRSQEFTAVAWDELRRPCDPSDPRRASWQLVSPRAATAARREAAYDGQHWACYHQYGGVAATLFQLFLISALR